MTESLHLFISDSAKMEFFSQGITDTETIISVVRDYGNTTHLDTDYRLFPDSDFTLIGEYQQVDYHDWALLIYSYSDTPAQQVQFTYLGTVQGDTWDGAPVLERDITPFRSLEEIER